MFLLVIACCCCGDSVRYGILANQLLSLCLMHLSIILDSNHQWCTTLVRRSALSFTRSDQSTVMQTEQIKYELARAVVVYAMLVPDPTTVEIVKAKLVIHQDTLALLTRVFTPEISAKLGPMQLTPSVAIMPSTTCAFVAARISNWALQAAKNNTDIHVTDEQVRQCISTMNVEGSSGEVFDCPHASETSLEADLVMNALQLYRDHALLNKKFLISEYMLAEVWIASLRAMWICIFNPGVYIIADSFQNIAKSHKDPMKQKLVIMAALANAIVQRMIGAVVSSRHGVAIQIQGIAIKVEDLDVPITGVDSEFVKRMINTQIPLFVTEDHYVPPSDMPPLEGGAPVDPLLDKLKAIEEAAKPYRRLAA